MAAAFVICVFLDTFLTGFLLMQVRNLHRIQRAQDRAIQIMVTGGIPDEVEDE